MREGHVRLLPVLLAAMTVGAAIWFFRRPVSVSDEPLASAPAKSFLVAKVDVAALRTSPLGELVDQVLRGLIPLPREAQRDCDIGGKLDSLAIVVPEGEDRSDLGVAMKARLTPDEQVRCAKALEQIVRSTSGGSGTGAGKPEASGPFSVIPTGDARADTLMVAPNGLVLLAPRAWASTMASTAMGRSPGALQALPHGDVLRSLGARHLVISVALPRATRERIRREMERELKPEDRRAMEGVLGVETLAAGLDVGAETDLAADLRCETTTSCSAVHELLTRKRKTWSENPILRLLGLGRALDASTLTLSPEGRRLEVRVRMATEDLRSALERGLVAWRKREKNAPP